MSEAMRIEFPNYDPGNLLHVAQWIAASRPSDPQWKPQIAYFLQPDGSYQTIEPPELITETPEYDPDNPLHVAKWEAAKQPDVNAVDGDGNRWRPSVATRLVDGEYVTETVPDPPPSLTAFEMAFQRIQKKLDGDEFKRTGKLVDPSGAVSRARAYAATAMIYNGYLYPSEEDLAVGDNPEILAAIYADPETNTTAESSTAQKQSALHFTLVMLQGQQFGLDYQSQLGAYERTASGAIREAIAADQRDWLDLPCHTWESVRAMFLDLLK